MRMHALTRLGTIKLEASRARGLRVMAHGATTTRSENTTLEDDTNKEAANRAEKKQEKQEKQEKRGKQGNRLYDQMTRGTCAGRVLVLI